MLTVVSPKYKLKDYLPLFVILCFSGNPIVTSNSNFKSLLILFTGLFTLYTIRLLTFSDLRKPLKQFRLVIIFILLISLFQFFSLGSVSFPGVLALIMKIMLGMFLMLLYQKIQLNIFDVYIKLLAFLARISIPFFALNFFIHTGYPIDDHVKSLLFYTSYDLPKDMLRNPGMFWEAGAFAGYLILALLFVTLVNGHFKIGAYKKEVKWLLIGLLTTMSTTGFLVLAILLLVYVFQNFSYGRVIILPIVIAASIYAYNNLEFLSEKIEEQYTEAAQMDKTDISNTRFGALNMDIQYIKSMPLIGNGLDKKTRYRFHPWIEDEIGHGNGMSNFLVYWGIPLFLFWVFCIYKFASYASGSAGTAIVFTICLLLVLQGEQFLNFPVFLLFFTAPAIQFK